MTAKPAATKKAAATRKPTTVSQWKKAQSEAVELPSGNYLRMRKVSMQHLVATGKIPNSLMSVMQQAIDKGTGKVKAGVDDQVMEELLSDDKRIREYMRFMDELVCMVSIEPKIHPTPETEDERDPEILYADEVDDEDKSFIFAGVTGGTTDLEQFRKQQRANVAALSGRENVELPTQPAAASD